MDIDLETLEEIMRELREKRRQSNAQAAESSSSGSSRSATPDRLRRRAPPQLSKETQILLGAGKESAEREAELLRQQVEEARRREEDAKREENTVFVTSLPLKATEEDIYTFLKEHKVGPVRDIRIIRDAATKRSKGMAYVEFYSPDSVQNAILLKKKLMGHVIVIAPPYADKNRTYLNSRPRPGRGVHSLEPPTKNLNRSILVKNLVGKLAEMGERDIEKLFAPFGAVEHVEMDFDGGTRRNSGQAIVRFAKSQAAETAIRKMNGFTVSGEPFIVGHLPAHLALSTFRSFDDAPRRAEAAAEAPSEVAGLARPQLAKVEQRMKQARHYSASSTKVLGLFNLFEGAELSSHRAREVKQAVKDECARFGAVKDVWVDRKGHQAVFVRFAHRSDCGKAFEALHERMFDMRPLLCGYFHRDVIED